MKSSPYKKRLFRAEDAMAIRDVIVRPQEREWDGAWSLEGWEEIATYSGLAYTGLRAGVVLACCGIVPQHESRAIAWVLMNKFANRSDLLWLTRGIRKFLDLNQRKPQNGQWSFARIDTVVSPDFEPGHKWMRLLGFKPEGLLKCYDQNGGDQIMYARIAPWAR